MDLIQSSLKIRILMQPPARSGSEVLNPLPWRNQVERLLGKMGLVNMDYDDVNTLNHWYSRHAAALAFHRRIKNKGYNVSRMSCHIAIVGMRNVRRPKAIHHPQSSESK